MLPSIFGENLFDSFFSEPFRMFEREADHELYGKHAAAVMRTDVREKIQSIIFHGTIKGTGLIFSDSFYNDHYLFV